MTFQVLQEIKHTDVRLWSPDLLALAIVPRADLKDAAGVSGDVDLDNEELLLLASANIGPLGRTATRKHETGEVMQGRPGDYPCVIVTAVDLVAAGEKLTAINPGVGPFTWGD